LSKQDNKDETEGDRSFAEHAKKKKRYKPKKKMIAGAFIPQAMRF
jgi:hypothetical protein